MAADTSVYVPDGGAIHYETAAIDWRIFPAGSLEKAVPFTFALKYSKRQDTLEFYLNGVKSDSSLATPGVGGYQPPSPVADTFCKDPSFANAVSYRAAASLTKSTGRQSRTRTSPSEVPVSSAVAWPSSSSTALPSTLRGSATLASACWLAARSHEAQRTGSVQRG